MKISLRILGEIKVDDNIYRLNIDTTCEKIGADKITADTIAEIVEDTVTIMLQHLSVGVETRVSELGDLLCKKLDSVCGIAEDNRLVDLKFGEEGVEAMDFLLLFHEAVVLGDSSEGKFIHKIDFVRIVHMFILCLVSPLTNTSASEDLL